ncbi:MAG: bifunctional tetrahydrofolate synthase/dihydrofolate synthase [Methylovulum sp.]|jgi:dihydrofolate synthase/folylpolyglutamate synthase|nr:bifunctional tetrahydrofolate synthase/dihydrofolate synthase [Methylovulum sp.]
MHFDTLTGWLKWQEGFHPLTIDLGLERANEVFTALNPNKTKPLTITVAGTNGKGSCIAYLEAIYLAQGYKVGAYTSPHILKYNERIKINGAQVSDEDICAAFARIEEVRSDHSLSYFEFGTLAAIDIFWRANLDIQLLEVGLGGRLDVVNIIDPDIAIISSIGIDHVNWLGSTREAIGAEKAGIFRPHVPAIVGDPQPPQSVLNHAKKLDADLYCLGKEFGFDKTSVAETWSWWMSNCLIEHLPVPNLKGAHQFRNASAVILATQLLAKQLPVTQQALNFGLQHVELAGRFQLIHRDNRLVLLDVGHNPEAVTTLAAYLADYFPTQQIYAVFAMMKDKDIISVLNIMKPNVKHWFFSPLTNARACVESSMRELFLHADMTNVSFGFSDFTEAFDAAKSQTQAEDIILVFGSFFLISDCLHEFEKGEITQ